MIRNESLDRFFKLANSPGAAIDQSFIHVRQHGRLHGEFLHRKRARWALITSKLRLERVKRMFDSNPFALVSTAISPTIMQAYLILMIIAVAGGTMLDLVHKRSAEYFFQRHAPWIGE
jgi:hypothetical protein